MWYTEVCHIYSYSRTNMLLSRWINMIYATVNYLHIVRRETFLYINTCLSPNIQIQICYLVKVFVTIFWMNKINISQIQSYFGESPFCLKVPESKNKVSRTSHLPSVGFFQLFWLMNVSVAWTVRGVAWPYNPAQNSCLLLHKANLTCYFSCRIWCFQN